MRIFGFVNVSYGGLYAKIDNEALSAVVEAETCIQVLKFNL